MSVSDDRPVVVLGEFDGFHLGHRQLVHVAARRAARDGRPLVGMVVCETGAGGLLSTVDERCIHLLSGGASCATAMSVVTPTKSGAGDDVVGQLVSRFDPALVVMACLPGTGEVARHPELRAALERRGVPTIEVPRWSDPDGSFVTSRRVRDALASGEVARVNDWLGRDYTITGTVVHGSGLGRTIGFPTANLHLPDGLALPRNGVYAAVVHRRDGSRHAAAVNIGVRPTIEHDGRLLVEAHLLDFDDDLYGTRLQVGFRRWLRDETRFGSLDDLVTQLATDVEHTRLVVRTA